MTEAEWASSANPRAMLRVVRQAASDRKLRLFACACARRYWGEFDHPRSREAVEVAERYADGLAGDAEQRAASQAACAVTRSVHWTGRGYLLRSLARDAAQRNIRGSVFQALANALSLAYHGHVHDHQEVRRSMEALQPLICADLRDLFGPCPDQPLALDPAVLAWNDRTVRHVAQALYNECDFARLPILADALEDAGCTDDAILGHCRGGGRHVRGCWVIDLCLGKHF